MDANELMDAEIGNWGVDLDGTIRDRGTDTDLDLDELLKLADAMTKRADEVRKAVAKLRKMHALATAE